MHRAHLLPLTAAGEPQPPPATVLPRSLSPRNRASRQRRFLLHRHQQWPTEEDHQLAKQVSGLDSGQVTTWTSWHRWTAINLLACAFLAVAAAWQRAADISASVLDLIPVTVPELLRQLRGTVIPEPRRNKPHRDAWALWRRRHQYGAQQAHQRWHAYADETPQ